jgi:hypothetical protein
VHAGSDPLLVGDPSNHKAKLLFIVGNESGTDGIVVLAGNTTNLL